MPPYHLIRFEGSLDISRYPEFRTAFEAAPHGVPVLIDLTLAESVDSTFLSEMVMFRRRHAAQVTALIPPSGHIRRIFAIAEMDERMQVFTDLSNAVAALRLAAPKDKSTDDLAAD